MPEKKPNASKRTKRASAKRVVSEPAATAIELTNEFRLPPQQESFVTLLAKGETQRAAYLKVFPQARRWTIKTVDERASRLARDDKVQARYRGLQAAAAKANDVDVAFVLAQYLLRLRADPRELTEVRVCACRFCYGKDHGYQRTDGELARDRVTHEVKREARLERDMQDIGEFDEQGGGGYSKLMKPNPECPSCAGGGAAQVVLKDSRDYSPGALALFGGVKEGKDGIEVKIGDRNDALMQIAKHLGFFASDNKVDVAVKVDVAALDAIYDAALAKSRADGEHARGRMGRITAKARAQLIDVHLPEGDLARAGVG